MKMNFTHFNENGRARMVDVSEKDETKRKAVARGYIQMGADTIKAVTEGRIKKGDVLSVAQVGGICGAKKNMGFDTYVPQYTFDRGRYKF